MRTTLCKTALALSLLTVSPTILAAENGGLFVEPGFTYSSYESSVKWPAPFTASDGEVNGLGLMARLGFHINEVFFVAADGRYSQPKFKDSTNNLDASATEFDYGPTVGIQMPNFGLRVWGTYIAGSELDPKISRNLDLKFTGGTGYRIGAGFKLFLLSLNLEYQKLDYDKTTVEAIGPFTPGTTTDVKFEGEGWIASLSFPLSI